MAATPTPTPDPADRVPRHFGELPTVQLTTDETDALVSLLARVAGRLDYHEERLRLPAGDRQADQVSEIARELSRRKSDGEARAMDALPQPEFDRLWEATYGESPTERGARLFERAPAGEDARGRNPEPQRGPARRDGEVER